MGRLLLDPNADFSAAPKGHAGLYTTVAAGLVALHELRYSRSKAAQNAAAGGLGGTPIGGGAIAYSAGSINIDKGHGFVFANPPGNGGLSIAFVLKQKNGGAATDNVLGSGMEGSTAATGYVLAEHYNRRVQIQATTYAAGSVPPLTGFTSLLAYLDFTAPTDGTFQLFIATAENNVALTLYHPKTGVSLPISAVGRDFAFDNPGAFRTCSESGTPAAQDVALFAHWSRVITSTERATFYAEMRDQMARYGMTI